MYICLDTTVSLFGGNRTVTLGTVLCKDCPAEKCMMSIGNDMFTALTLDPILVSMGVCGHNLYFSGTVNQFCDINVLSDINMQTTFDFGHVITPSSRI